MPAVRAYSPFCAANKNVPIPLVPGSPTAADSSWVPPRLHQGIRSEFLESRKRFLQNHPFLFYPCYLMSVIFFLRLVYCPEVMPSAVNRSILHPMQLVCASM